MELQGIQLTIRDQVWRIYNVYAHVDKLHIADNWDFLEKLSDVPRTKFLIAGDFNARSKEWGNATENRQGIALSSALLNSDLTILNDGRPTRLASRPEDTDGVIDLALISTTDATFARWNVLGAQESDYLPCVVLLNKVTNLS